MSNSTTATTLRQIGDASLRPAPLTVPQMFRHSVQGAGPRTAILFKENGSYQPITYTEMNERVRALAAALIALGLEHGDRVGLLSENRPEWAITDIALLTIGTVNVPLYSTLPPAQIEYILANSEARAVFVSSQKQLEKVIAIREQVPLIRHVILMDPTASLPEGVLSFTALIEQGRAMPEGDSSVQARAEQVKPEDLASIIYTSGTTGNPKGAMLSHDNFMSNAQAAAPMVTIHPSDVFLSFLPLSHVFERMAGHYFPLLVGATIAYAESVFTVQTNMGETHPTIMASVPRLYESIHSRLADGIQRRPSRERKMAEWAVGVGTRYHAPRWGGPPPGLMTRLLYPIADRLVLSKMREKATGGRLRFFISGGAPLPTETGRYLTAIGLNILEGYGLTETSPVISLNPPTGIRIGTVGVTVPGVEVRIADDGEILSRGPHIMRGYFNMPEATEQAINADGWFHTGDIGIIDGSGYLHITDRKKDILVLANGKNVAPQPIENTLKASPYVSAAVLFGDRQPQVVALIVPDLDHLKRWAREQGFETKDVPALLKRPEVIKLYKQEIERLSGELADFERIKRFALLTREFSAEQGELTPTLKIKRKAVAANFSAELDQLYK